MNIGTPYNEIDSNCAHFVADWYNQNKGITIPTTHVFELSFVVWMRRNFKQIKTPVEGCLVKMKSFDGSAHVGVFTDFMVIHNFKGPMSKGSVCKWTIGSIINNYKEVTYWLWSK